MENQNLTVVRTLNKIRYNTLRDDIEDYIAFVIEPKNLIFDYLAKTFSIKLTTFIVREAEEFVFLKNEDGTPKLLDNGNQDFIIKKVDQLIKLNLPQPLSGFYTQDDVNATIAQLKLLGIVTEEDDELTRISKTLIHGVMFQLSLDEHITLDLSDLILYTLRK